MLFNVCMAVSNFSFISCLKHGKIKFQCTVCKICKFSPNKYTNIYSMCGKSIHFKTNWGGMCSQPRSSLYYFLQHTMYNLIYRDIYFRNSQFRQIWIILLKRVRYTEIRTQLHFKSFFYSLFSRFFFGFVSFLFFLSFIRLRVWVCERAFNLCNWSLDWFRCNSITWYEKKCNGFGGAFFSS